MHTERLEAHTATNEDAKCCAEEGPWDHGRIGHHLVTLRVGLRHPVPQHEKLLEQLRKLVPLRDILTDSSRELILIDTNQGRRDTLAPPRFDAQERVKRSFDVPGYPDATAKITIKRATKRF